MPSFAELCRPIERTLPDPACPECRGVRLRTADGWWCERCLCGEPVEAAAPESAAPVAMPGQSLDDIYQHAQTAEPVAVDPPPPAYTVPEIIGNPGTPGPVIPAEIRYCTGEGSEEGEHPRAMRDVRYGRMVCPACGDAKQIPGEPEPEKLMGGGFALPIPKKMVAKPLRRTPK